MHVTQRVYHAILRLIFLREFLMSDISSLFCVGRPRQKHILKYFIKWMHGIILQM